MKVEIVTIPLGFDRCYVLKGDGVVAIDAVARSWELLLAAGVRTVYPAHGQPFPATVIEQALARASGADRPPRAGS